MKTKGALYFQKEFSLKSILYYLNWVSLYLSYSLSGARRASLAALISCLRKECQIFI